MCGLNLKNRISSEELNERMGVVCVAVVVRQGSSKCLVTLSVKDERVLACGNCVCDRRKR